jgi:rod shape-determining protein MreD
VAAALLQTVVIARIGWAGSGPDLLLLAVIAVGLATTPNYGALVGFGAGILADVLPPDVTTLGTTAFVLALVGYITGGIKDPRGMAVIQLLGLLAGLAFAASATQLLLAWALADRAVSATQSVGCLLVFTTTTAFFGLLLVPMTVARLRRMDRRGGVRERHDRRGTPQTLRK